MTAPVCRSRTTENRREDTVNSRFMRLQTMAVHTASIKLITDRGFCGAIQKWEQISCEIDVGEGGESPSPDSDIERTHLTHARTGTHTRTNTRSHAYTHNTST